MVSGISIANSAENNIQLAHTIFAWSVDHGLVRRSGNLNQNSVDIRRVAPSDIQRQFMKRTGMPCSSTMCLATL